MLRPNRTAIRFFSFLLFLAAPAAAEPRWDVSYLWHSDLEATLDYREEVAAVLGPEVGRDLKVVRGRRNYGLLYRRSGDERSAVEAAHAHAELLRAAGLHGAEPIRSRAWADAEPKAAAPAPARPEAGPRPGDWDSELEAGIERLIKRLRQQGRLKPDERTAWSIYDLRTGRKLVTINEDEPMQAASLIKPFLALAYFAKAQEGGPQYGPKARRKMRAMIQHSSNPATNWVLRQLGGPEEAQRYLKRRFPGLFLDTRLVEYIPPGGRTFRNQASAHDYSRFLYALWHDQLPGSAELKRLMSLPNGDRLVRGAAAVPGHARVLDKTGSTSRLCGDMGILQVRGRDGRQYAYTLIGLIEKEREASSYSRWIRSRGNVIREVSNLAYRTLTSRDEARTASAGSAR